MASLLAKLFTLFGGSSNDRDATRRLLSQCERERARVEIAHPSQTDTNAHRPIVTAIVEVRKRDFITLAMRDETLPTGEMVDVNIVQANGRRITFQCKVLGTCRTAEGNDERQSDNQRLAIPRSVQVVNQRRHVRVSLTGMPVVEVSLRPRDSAESIHGVMRDISLGGARVEIDGSAMLLEGTRVLMVATLPRPSVPLAEAARVIRVERYKRSGRAMIALMFEEEVTAIEPFVRYVEKQRASRAKRSLDP